jgi:hypothetical protein
MIAADSSKVLLPKRPQKKNHMTIIYIISYEKKGPKPLA